MNSTVDDGLVSVVGLEWERIQLVIHLGPSASASVDLTPSDFLLRSSASPAPLEARPSRREPPEDGAVAIRLNVFAGTDQMPLEPGRWQLYRRRPGAEPELVPVAPAARDAVRGARDFVYSGGMYRVETSVGASDAALVVTISTWSRAGSGRRPRNPWQRLQSLRRRVVTRVRVGTFQLLLRILGRLPRRRRLIVFTSDSRNELGGNLKIVHDRMVERGLDRRFRLATILKASISAKRSLRDRLRLAWLFSRADVILLDDYQPAVYRVRPREGVRIIQLWHAWGAFKTVGYSRLGKPGGPNPYSSVHKNYTYAVVGSHHEAPFYAEAFGLPEERVRPTGIPRMDEFLDPANQEAGRQRVMQAFPAAAGKEVILFAPTFRGAGARSARYPMELIDFGALDQLARERDAVVIFKMHPFVRAAVPIPEAYADRLIDASRRTVEVNDLLLVADILVTDYSSLVFEYSTRGKPMLFFAFDLDAYVASRDFYEPYEQFVPGPIVRTFPELLDAIRAEAWDLDAVRAFARRHMPEERGSATDRIIDELILPS